MKTKILCVFCLVLIVAAACSLRTIPVPDPTAAAVPQSAPPTDAIFTPIPIFTAVPEPTSLSESLKLGSIPFSETKDGPVYTFTAQIPQLQGSDDPRVAAFNVRLNDLVKNEVDKFRADILDNQPVVPFALGSAFDLKYTLIGQRGEVWSIKFDVYYNYDGSAHPGSYFVTLNYDLAQGRELTLDDLFLHGVNHLQTIADYCKAQLLTRDVGFEMSQTGADPTPENYRNWNLSTEGLIITFDAYQVAAYAAGPQTVVIPYAELQSLANPQGALQIFAR